jgi:propionate CoA-transferase
MDPSVKQVYAIVNYDNHTIYDELLEAYAEMVGKFVDLSYPVVIQYTTSAFFRIKTGDAPKKRNIVPHINETMDEASNTLKKF